MTMEKKTAAVIFGGQSSEHVVSCMSAANVIDRINTDKYNLVLIGITQEGKWLKVDSVQAIRDESWRKGTVSAAILPDAEKKCALFMENGTMTEVKLDVVFPVLHGLCGEDGTIQGLLELAKIPYVGCGVLASAVSMDKLYTKIIVDELGIRQADYVPVMREQLEDMDKVADCIEGRFAYPVFIKPSNAGSSKGVSKAENREELAAGLLEAARHDRKILVEASFYDFDAKYYNAESKTVTDPELPGDAAEKIRRAAAAIFKAVDGYGLSRVDFFVKEDGEVVFNEINTMPGFTAISMYPMLWEARGIGKEQLVDLLLEHGLKRFN